MTRNLIFLALLTVWLSSCKKTSSPTHLPSYYITCYVDGIPKTFNYNIYSWGAFSLSGNARGNPYLSIGGYNDSLMTQHLSFNVLVISDTALWVHANTYPDSIFTAYTEFYYINVPDTFQAGSQMYRSATTPIDNHFILNITYSDDVSVKGNFSGDAFQDGVTSNSKKTITKGDFYVPLQPL